MSSTTPTRILRQPEVSRLIGHSRTWLYRMAKTGAFPAPISTGSRSIGWLSDTVESWIASRPAPAAYRVADSTNHKNAKSPAGGQALRGGTVNGNNYRTT